jgi:2-isopropylmalate synthase
MHLVVSELAGRSNVVLKARELGLDIDAEQAAAVLAEVKDREARGWTYEAADASFELLLRRTLGLLGPDDEPFRSQHYRVSVGGGRGRPAHSNDAADRTVRPRRSSRCSSPASASSGPGRATARSTRSTTRSAARSTAPGRSSTDVHLSDYKVRILEASHGTDAVTRVLVRSTDGRDTWDTVGVHPNIVEASWLALSDAYTHAILREAW